MAPLKPIELPAVVDAAAIAAVTDKVKAAMKGTRKNLSIDLAKVERMDTLGLQLLLSAEKTCVERQGTLTLLNTPQVVLDAAVQLGLTGLFKG